MPLRVGLFAASPRSLACGTGLLRAFRCHPSRSTARPNCIAKFQKPFRGGSGAISVYPKPVVNGVIGLQLNDLPAGQYHARLVNDLKRALFSADIRHEGSTAYQKIAVAET